MATTEGLKQRPIDHDNKPTSTTPSTNKTQKMIKTKRGFRSLVIAITIPVILSATSAYLAMTHGATLPLHLGNIVISAITGLSAWLVWAKGGFHRQPQDMILFIGQLFLGFMWGPLMFRVKGRKLAVAMALGFTICLFGCSWSFRKVNKVAGDILVPCLAWALFLVMFSYKSM